MPSALLPARSLARAAVRSAQHPVSECIAPCRMARPRRRFHSTPANPVQSSPTKRSVAAAIPQDHAEHSDITTPHNTAAGTPVQPLSQEQHDFLDSALRVNQAGELAAVLIYAAQTPPLLRAHPHLKGLMKHMHDQEVGHFRYFNSILAKHRIRPTAMYPVWHAAATVLGWGTAVIGKEAAMACTEAVETEIGTHYNEQVRVLLDWADKLEARGETLGEELTVLIEELRRIRDEELEHLDHAVENDSKEAKPYELLTNVIRGGCRTAIWISEKV
ncbi:ubiquinone biosynthesis protein CAT5 [Karstenula rhodostoma CBS 690.94]|uniref:5-demethoxyubiquinone hydroxylase, mitochondrial n=1 Tax=Karstenula rhodostoma CBS 690.94 TaxID=1392251 RepID=A0A9P4PQG3_9PLEO|nr:ubiquinone biosynthesis protein CAT5 [Karstenula rhodostoma CBS 690.94]